jgi:hypothetical protein
MSVAVRQFPPLKFEIITYLAAPREQEAPHLTIALQRWCPTENYKIEAIQSAIQGCVDRLGTADIPRSTGMRKRSQ